MWDGERFRFGIEWRERPAQNPRLPAVPYRPFAKCANDGHPLCGGVREFKNPGHPPTEARATDDAARVRAEITGVIRKHPPALTEAYNHALQKEADKQAMKKPPQKETRTGETEKKAHNLNQGNVACDFHHHFRTVPGME
jgi:hypothetical protein